MTSQLFIYNKALGYLGERRLATLADPREPRRVLDDYWSDALQYTLIQGLWEFAMRTVQIDASATVIPAFGWNFAFNYPTDWIRTRVVSTSPQMDTPLLQMLDQA